MTVPLKPASSPVDERRMRRTRLLSFLLLVAVTAGCSAGGDQTVSSAQATTTSVVSDPVLPTVPFPFPIPLTDIPPPPGVPALPPGGGEVLNIHSRVVPYTPGQTSWVSSGAVSIAVRTDRPPKVGEPVTFEVVLATTGVACCGVVLDPGDGASFDAGGGLGCLPPDRAGTTAASFRWVHAFERSGRFGLRVTARAGTCSETAETGGLSGVIEVT